MMCPSYKLHNNQPDCDDDNDKGEENDECVRSLWLEVGGTSCVKIGHV
jgi:hypothetical protein